MLSKTNIILSLLFCTAVLACTTESTREKLEGKGVTPATDTIFMANFEVFYNQFQKDSLFQIEHIIFPLASKTEHDGWLIDQQIRKEDWKIHKPIDDMGGTYVTTLTNFRGIIEETTEDQSGQFTMIRRFAKVSDSWQLIFYKPMGK